MATKKKPISGGLLSQTMKKVAAHRQALGAKPLSTPLQSGPTAKKTSTRTSSPRKAFTVPKLSAAESAKSLAAARKRRDAKVKK